MAARVCTMIAMALVLPGTVLAAGSDSQLGDPDHGHHLAEAFCAECHPVTGDDDAPGHPSAPSFVERANDPATTPLALRVFLRTPHWEMPNIRLSPDQTDDIVAYILSLKGSHGATGK